MGQSFVPAWSGRSGAEIFQYGFERHQSGQFEQAEAAYRHVLALAPDHADALHLLGVLCYQRRRPEQAIDYIGRAIGLNNGNALYHNHAALALRALGRLGEAEASAREAIRLAPDFAEAHSTLGMIHRGAGRLADAEICYREALRLNPALPEAHGNLGNALCQLGRFEDGVLSFCAALRLDPGFPEALIGLGNALRTLGRPGEAEPCYRQVLRQRPGNPDIHNSLGLALRALDRPAEAENCCREALRLNPGFAPAHNSLGMILNGSGQPAEAALSYRAALHLKPDYPEAHDNLGVALCALGRLAEAEASHRAALRLKPDFAEAHNNLGVVLLALARPEEAAASHRAALRLKPDLADAQTNLGNDLLALGRLDEAEACQQAALRLKPDFAEAQSNLGNVLLARGRLGEAEQRFRTAISLKPDFANGHINLGNVLLLTGQMAAGWPEYEWRLLAPRAGQHGFVQPLWTGEALGDRVLLVHAEQGLGDTLQFCRYVPLVASRARLVFEAQAPLLPLLSSLPGVEQIVAQGEALPDFDVHCPLLSLPRILGTVLDTIPGRVPYLSADPLATAAWRRRLAPLDGLKIGLAWAGNPDMAADRRRSIALRQLASLAAVPGVSFVSLQKGGPAAQIAAAPPGLVLHDWPAELTDFAATAALITALDLVISVDTSVAHLTGALGKPVWLLNRFDTCWRWLLGRDDSPWYPTLRQFRQPVAGDWESVIADVQAALTLFVGASRRGD